MRIALINENSQAAKNGMIEKALRKVVEPMGHTVDNYGMYSQEDAAQLTYVQNGTGEGAMLALNSFPGVLCGHIVDPSDGFMFAQINDGNAVSFPFAKGFGWGAELNLEYTFEKLFGFGSGNGYPPERVVPEQRNKKILDQVRANNLKDLVTCLKGIDPELVRGAIAGPRFKELFFASAKDKAIIDYVRSVLG